MIFKALVIPNLGGLNQCNQSQILPILRVYPILRADLKQTQYVSVGKDGSFLLHLASHHDQLYKIFDILPAPRALDLIRILVIEAR